MTLDSRVRALVVATAASAARSGLDITDCPYSPTSEPEPARLWVGAYLAAKPPIAVDYDAEGDDEDDEEDDEGDDDEEDDLARTRDGRELHKYWTAGPGLAKWRGSPRPFTTLLGHLRKYMSEDKARRTTADWFREVMGYLPGPRRPRKSARPAAPTTTIESIPIPVVDFKPRKASIGSKRKPSGGRGRR